MIRHLPFGRAPYEPVARKKLNTAAAEVAPLTFFRYFPTKEDVVLGHYEERMELLKRALAERPDGEPAISAVRHAFAEVARDFESKREGVLQRARSAGAVAAMRASTETWVAERGGSPLPARLDRALDLIERGLGR